MTRRCCAHRRHAAGICLSGFCACQRPMTAKARKAMEHLRMLRTTHARVLGLYRGRGI